MHKDCDIESCCKYSPSPPSSSTGACRSTWSTTTPRRWRWRRPISRSLPCHRWFWQFISGTYLIHSWRPFFSGMVLKNLTISIIKLNKIVFFRLLWSFWKTLWNFYSLKRGRLDVSFLPVFLEVQEYPPRDEYAGNHDCQSVDALLQLRDLWKKNL